MMMMRTTIAWLSIWLPLTALACESTSMRTCEKEIAQLISYRTRALESAFGELSALPEDIGVKFVSQKDPEYASHYGRVAYDRKHATVIVPRRYVSARTPNPLRMAAYYWPFYENNLYREEFSLIGAIDSALWEAYLQEAANKRGLGWPHEDCASIDVGKRLPCEMVLRGIAEFVTAIRTPIFNENRVDRIWPENFAEFRHRVWSDDPEYRDVQRYGGILLLRPLIGEFGIPRALAYIAQTPFRVEESSLRVAALRYQQGAREALRPVPEQTVDASVPVPAVAQNTTSRLSAK
jgi:hypothetical protein